MIRPSRSNLQFLRKNTKRFSNIFILVVIVFLLFSYYKFRWMAWRDIWRFVGLTMNGISAGIITYVATSGFKQGKVIPRVKQMVQPIAEAEALLRDQGELSKNNDREDVIILSNFLEDRFNIQGEIKEIQINQSYNTPPGPSSRRVEAEVDGDTENVCSIGELNNAIQSRGEQWTATVEGVLTILFLKLFILGVAIQIATYLPRIAEIFGLLNG